jgi:hypothetical protein
MAPSVVEEHDGLLPCRQPDVLVNMHSMLAQTYERLTLTDRRRTVRLVTFTKHEQPLPGVYWSGTIPN